MRLLYFSALMAALWVLYSFINYIVELHEFKSNIIEQTKLFEVKAHLKSTELKNSLLRADTNAKYSIEDILSDYDRLLNERLHNSLSGDKQMPSDTKPTQTHKHTQNSKPSKASGDISKRLLKCEERLINEAKEYDILATHYNVLLQAYEQARLTNDGEKKYQANK